MVRHGLTKVLTNHGLELYNNQVDIGVRVETSNIVMEEINKNLYEGKFVYNTSVGTKVRTFLFKSIVVMLLLKTIVEQCLLMVMLIMIQNLEVKIQTLLYLYLIHLVNHSMNQMNLPMK